MEKKQTAVEWIIDGMSTNPDFIGNDLLQAANQARTMEKQQIIEAWQKNPQGYNHTGEQYYNETFKTESE